MPQNASAPEITGHGFSTKSNPKNPLQRDYSLVNDEDLNYTPRDDSLGQNNLDKSPLCTIMARFTIIVSLAFFIALIVPGGLGSPRGRPESHDLTVKARVDKILSENPLIGC